MKCFFAVSPSLNSPVIACLNGVTKICGRGLYLVELQMLWDPGQLLLHEILLSSLYFATVELIVQSNTIIFNQSTGLKPGMSESILDSSRGTNTYVCDCMNRSDSLKPSGLFDFIIYFHAEKKNIFKYTMFFENVLCYTVI